VAGGSIVLAVSSLGSLLLLALPAAPVAPDPTPTRTVAPGDQATLQTAGLLADGPTLLKFLQRRADPEGSLKFVDDAITRLADGDKGKFVPAQSEILGYGAVALPALHRLANRVEQPEASARARACIEHIEGTAGSHITLAVLRAATALRPDGVEAALFAYLPFAESEQSFRETHQLLSNLLPGQGDIPPAYTKALQDADPIRRQAAAEVLCSVYGVSAHALVRPLLNDPKTSVRLRAAMALTESYDPAAVPVLIDLLSTEIPSERRRIEELLTRLAGDWSFTAPPTEDRVAGDLRRALWKAWWDTLSEERLVGMFRAVTQSEDDYLTWQAVLARLNDSEAAVREKAVADLVAIGPRVLPLVRRLTASGTPRERTLAAQAVAAIERGNPAGKLPECAPRLLALRRPVSTVQVLIDALPWMDSPLVEQQVRDVLPVIAREDGKVVPVLWDRLKSKLPVLRAVAVATLARVGDPADLARLRDLLADPDLNVRLAAAAGLTQRGERTAVPVLIDLLANLPLEQAGEVEDLLVELAGDKAPPGSLGVTPEERTRCRDAWAAWWQGNGSKVVLEDSRKLHLRPRTMILIESYDQVRRNGRVVELDRSGRILLDVSGLSYPMYAERIGTDRLLVAEQGVNKISERDAQGRIVKEWAVPSAFCCQRLRNGNTFLGGRNLLQEVDREGKVIWSYQSQAETILAATRFRDGHSAVLTYQGTFTHLDGSGKPIKTFHLPLNTLGGINAAEILAGNRVLCTSSQNRIVEFDDNGKIVWEASVMTPQCATRLSRGTTLVTIVGGLKLLEIDRSSRVVQEWKDLPVKPIRAILR
jgi:HEAT repeat protein